MKVEIPSGVTDLLVPEEFHGLNVSQAIIHQSLWHQKAGPGDICVSSGFGAPEIVEFVQGQKNLSFVQNNSQWFQRDLKVAVKIAQAGLNLVADPIGTICNDKNIGEWTFTDGTQKDSIFSQMVSRLTTPSQGLIESIRAVFEEFYMNAVLDAPRESIRAGLEKYGYEKMPAAKIMMGFDENRLVLACTDPYGTLDTSRFTERMNEVYKKGAGQVVNLKREIGGAGLGCVILFEHSAGLFLAVEKGRRTTFVSQIPLTMNHRQRALIQKSFYIVNV